MASVARASTRVRLVVSRDEAGRLLTDVISRGESIAATGPSVRDESTFKEWAGEATRWRKFAITVLQTISEEDALEQEFARAYRPGVTVVGGPPDTVPERLERRRRTHEAELNVLRSVVERLTLFPAPEQPASGAAPTRGEEVFVVHGHQQDAAGIVARLIEQLGLSAVILDERANQGRTLIEKFEQNTEEVGFAVVLMLADDWGKGPDDDQWPIEPNRARQNVVLELGYFVGKLGRGRVAALMGASVEKPSDIHGLAYIAYDDDWRMRLIREMKSVFPSLDANKVFD